MSELKEEIMFYVAWYLWKDDRFRRKMALADSAYRMGVYLDLQS